MTPSDIYNAPVSNDTRRAIRTCTDLDVLVDALAMEQARGRGLAPGSTGAPRKSMMDLLQLRIDVLHAMQAAASDDEPTTAQLMAGTPLPPGPMPEAAPVPADDVVPEAGGRSTAYMAGRDAFAQGLSVDALTDLEAVRGYTDMQALVADEPQFVRAASEPVQAQANPAQHFATTFVRALLGGDAAMLAVLVQAVRQREFTADEVASALLVAHAAQATKASQPRAPRAPSAPREPSQPGTGRTDPVTDTNVARVRAAVAAGTPADGGVVVLSAEQMQAAGFPASWIAHGTLWSRKGRIAVAALVVGYDARYHNTQAGPVAMFTPVPAPLFAGQ